MPDLPHPDLGSRAATAIPTSRTTSTTSLPSTARRRSASSSSCRRRPVRSGCGRCCSRTPARPSSSRPMAERGRAARRRGSLSPAGARSGSGSGSKIRRRTEVASPIGQVVPGGGFRLATRVSPYRERTIKTRASHHMKDVMSKKTRTSTASTGRPFAKALHDACVPAGPAIPSDRGGTQAAPLVHGESPVPAILGGAVLRIALDLPHSPLPVALADEPASFAARMKARARFRL